jgi:hypothetical protein
MNKDGKNERPPAAEGPSPCDGAARSGEGADTALEALIRKRRQQGGDGADLEATDQPPPQAA